MPKATKKKAAPGRQAPPLSDCISRWSSPPEAPSATAGSGKGATFADLHKGWTVFSIGDHPIIPIDENKKR